MSTTEAANRNVMIRAISSPSRSRDKREREPARGPAPGTVVDVVATLLNVAQSLLFHGDHLFGKARVRKSLGIILPVNKHPRNETLDSVALRRVRDFRGDEQPGKTGNGVGLLARSVSDGHSEIFGHRLGSAGGGGGDPCERGFDENAGSILHVAVRDLVGFGVDKLNVTNGTGGVFDGSRNTLIALASQSNRPLHVRALADFGFPFLADLGKEVGPDIACAARFGAMYDDNVVAGEVNPRIW